MAEKNLSHHPAPVQSHAPVVDYRTYNGYRMTYDRLVYHLELADRYLLEAEVRASEQGNEDLSDAFADARECIIDMLPELPRVARQQEEVEA